MLVDKARSLSAEIVRCDSNVRLSDKQELDLTFGPISLPQSFHFEDVLDWLSKMAQLYAP
jgi:hypothetical protein